MTHTAQMTRKAKRAVTLAVSYLAAAALTLGVLAGVQYEKAKRYELAANNAGQHAFEELVTAVEEVDHALQKSVYARSPGLAGALCTEVFGKTMTAQMSLGALPYGADELEQTAGFLSRVGDYAFALSRAAAGGRALTAEELDNLASLSDTASVLALNLRGLQSELLEGRLRLTELSRAETTLDEAQPDRAAYAGDSIRRIEQEFPEVPALIYDGPFSEHLTGLKPRALEGLEEVSEAEARRAAAAFLGVNRAKVSYAGELTDTDIPCRTYAVDGEGGSAGYVAVTNRGGKILYYLSSRPAGSARTGAAKAVETAKRFLAENGYTDMAETYHIIQDGVLTANFAWRQGDVLCYSDLVKVSVALDSGRVCGFEARGYLTAHTERELPEIQVWSDEAMGMIPEGLELRAWQLALVPSDGRYETLCHEFKCTAGDDRNCIIYVNAVTGEQEKILLLLEDETGTLTI